MKKKILLFLLISFLFSITLILAEDWYKGTLHDHTGYSTKVGYDGDYWISMDNCPQEGLPWANYIGYNVTELKEQAENLGLNFQSYTDHSYCLNSSEFDVVKTDCQNAQDSSFTCLSGEELSVEENTNDFEPICPLKSDGTAHLGAHGISDFISQNPATSLCPDSPNTQNGISSINSNTGLSIINHPDSHEVGLEFMDFESINIVSNYVGIEIWNGEWEGSFNNNGSAKSKWKEFLLDGKKVFAYGGTDTHEEASDVNINYVYLNSLNSSNLKTALEQGYSSISNNGEMYIEVYDPYNETWEHMGRNLNVCEDDTINISVTYDVNNACTLKIYKGVIGSGLESVEEFNISGSGSEEITNSLSDDAYFRSECISSDGEYRIYSNPIWIELSPDSDSDGYCNLNDCNDNNGGVYPGATEYCDGVDNDCDGIVDEGCEGSEPPEEPTGNLTECNETGYDQCIQYEYGDCMTKIAVNHYTNVNNIYWGIVNDSSDPFVVKNYTFGWKKVSGNQMYYDVLDPGTDGTKDCVYGGGTYIGGCHTGERLYYSQGTKTTVFSPGTAYRKMILGYDETESSACWVWFNEFNPSYGTNNPIYVLNCFNDNECSSGYFCDKTGNWSDWSCILKKSDGQNCSSDSQCSSGYCDNDGVGLNDDGWCFTPYNTYFDNQKTNYCEYSTGLGDVNCDEKQIGNGCGSDCKYSINAPNESTIIHPNGNEIFDPNTNIIINWTLSTDSNKDFIRYNLQYSNDSGGNWSNIISNYGYENKLNDSSTEKVLIFSGNENKTVYIRLPKKAKVSYARLDLGGLSL
jgi:hypothetical protein